MTTRILAIFSAVLLASCCLAEDLMSFNGPLFEGKERISLAVLLEAFAQDANYIISYCDYEERKDWFDVRRRWMVSGEGKQAFLKNFGKWLDADSVELVAHDGFRDIVKDWFCVSTREWKDGQEASDGLVISVLPLEKNAGDGDGQRYVRIEYVRLRLNPHEGADCYVWCGKEHKSTDAVPSLPAGQEICLDISSHDVDFARCPNWCENTMRFNLRNRGDKPIRLLRVTAISDFLKPQLKTSLLSPGEDSVLEVAVKPNVFFGQFVREIILETDAPGQEFIRLPITGEALPAVQIIPEREQLDSHGEKLPGVVTRQGNQMFAVMPGDQEVWIGELRPEEMRTQSFQLIPYDKSFQLSILEQERPDDAKFRLIPIPEGYRLDVTVCPTKIQKEGEVHCAIAIDASAMRNLYDDPLDDKKPFVFATPSPVEITVSYSMETEK
ncbi:MAG: DUF1573 domain-containing protein [Victivallales bacterium]|nr:DUF1573 domain-containing protein [Victivallales bacterium]